MIARFSIIAPERPESLLNDARRSLPPTVELLHHASIDDLHTHIGQDRECAGLLVYELEKSRLERAFDQVTNVLGRDPTLDVVVALRDGSRYAAAARLFRPLTRRTVIVPQQDFGAVREALFFCLERQSQRRHHEDAEYQGRWLALAMAYSRALQLRDDVTQLHSFGVRNVCELVGKHLQGEFALTEGLRFQLRIAAWMHDAGKVQIASSILQKPEKLDEEEWKRMLQHPETGLRDVLIMTSFPGLLEGIDVIHRRLERVLRHLLWPGLLLLHHWYPPYAPNSRPYPERIESALCLDYLRLLGFTQGSLAEFFLELLTQGGHPDLVSASQLRAMWATIRSADIIDARYFPRPYHRAATKPTLDEVLRDLRQEADLMAKTHPLFGQAQHAVLDVLTGHHPELENCLSRGGMAW